MRVWRNGARGVLLVALAMAAGSAMAQKVYRCTNGSTTTLSDKPCSDSVAPRLGAYGNTGGSVPVLPASYTPSAAPAAEHLRYLGAECAAVSEAIRTAPTRGVRGPALAALRRDYRARCSDDDLAARRSLADEQSLEREERRRERTTREAVEAQARQDRQQCDELRRILLARHPQLATLSAGEKADFERFENSYNARCMR